LAPKTISAKIVQEIRAVTATTHISELRVIASLVTPERASDTYHLSLVVTCYGAV